jgi:hypothetical protein
MKRIQKEVYEIKPRHRSNRDLDWEQLEIFLRKFYPTETKKYEYHLFNPRWKKCFWAWQVSCALKIDCVVEITDRMSDIIETDPLLFCESLGQLLIYKYWYENQTGKKVRKMIALCREVQEQIAEVMLMHNIEIYIIRDGTIKKYFSQIDKFI